MQVDVQVVPVACRKDNYAYLVSRADSTEAVVIDACEAGPIQRELETRKLTLRAILTTHHHHDHVGGNIELVERWGVPVFGHSSETSRIPKLSALLHHGECFSSCGIHFVALHVPAHTRGALAYLTGNFCFTGDTLFTAGAGRLFEGTPAELYHALFQVFGRMESSTVFCTGHEYTQKNLEFALHIEPTNAAVQRRYREVLQARQLATPTAMAPLGVERATNPFLRVGQAAIARGLGLEPNTDPVLVMRALRAARNEF